jgi:tetratricopeptide (TPR) repeat protein
VRNRRKLLLILIGACSGIFSQEAHNHGVPHRLGSVSFPVSCSPSVQTDFNRGVALLHSFAYAAATSTFQEIDKQDPSCAMAHWGIAMTYFHQLWEPQLAPPALPIAQREIEIAQKIGTSSARERGYIRAFRLVVENSDSVPFTARNLEYEQAMGKLASANPEDLEAQVFYALALISNDPPTDRTHLRDKQALALLEPLDQKYPDHPGITHYVIHACDSSELAPRGLAAARKYAKVAPDAPHALHMPSHIFTRLGMWNDSIASNLAARKAASEQGDVGEELHAMDYLVYAYLQLARSDEARAVIENRNRISNVAMGDFKAGYAATAMPARYAVERHQWDEAAKIEPVPGSPPHIAAIAVWARALGLSRGGHVPEANDQIIHLQQYEDHLRSAGNEYWGTQTSILRKEAMAWVDEASGKLKEAEAQMRAAADEEDAIEKLPVTPGPIIPAREQLGELLLDQQRPSDAVVAFRASLVNAPGRRGATEGLLRAAQMLNKH